jgi:hypothetical protein
LWSISYSVIGIPEEYFFLLTDVELAGNLVPADMSCELSAKVQENDNYQHFSLLTYSDFLAFSRTAVIA